MATRRASLLFVILLFLAVFIVPAAQISLPQMTIPKIPILPFPQITIPKVTIPSINLPSLGSLPRVFAITPTLNALSPADDFAGKTILVSSPALSFGSLPAGLCSLTSSPTGLIASYTCSISAVGTLSGNFVVSSAAPGQGYTVTATDLRTGGGTTANAAFTVDPAATVTPTSGSPRITGPPTAAATTVSVTGTGFSPGDTGCTITSGAGTLIINPADVTCSINTSTGRITGTFKVGDNSLYTGGLINVVVTGTLSGDTPTVAGSIPTFTVVPNLAISPISGNAGTTINYAGSGFTGFPTETIPSPGPCEGFAAGQIGGTPVASGPASSACNEDVNGRVIGSFTVAAVASGTYPVTFTDTSGSPLAIANFIKTGGPIISLSAFQGPVGTIVTITGSGFNGGDTSVSITNVVSSVTQGLFTPDPLTQPCSVSGGNVAAGCTFTVAATKGGLAGGFTVTANGNTGDSSAAGFLVLATLTLTPNNGASDLSVPGPGTLVTLSGSGYIPVGAACTGPTPVPTPLFTALTCSIAGPGPGAGVLSGSFNVNNLAIAGAHTVTITNAAQVPQTTVAASFTVTLPLIVFTPSSGSGGDTIGFSASGFSTGDATCSLSQPTLGKGITIAAVPLPTCSISGGVATGSFVVVGAGNGAETKTLKLAGNTGDAVSASFGVVPKISLSPNPARVGATVTVTGSNFGTKLAGCTMAGASVGAVVVACTVAGDYTATGSFTVLVTFASLSDTITVTDTTPISASATLNIIPHVVTLSPASGPVGASISVTGTGFSTADTCGGAGSTIAGTPVPAATTCSVASSGTLTGSFVVKSGTLPGAYTVTLTGVASGDFGTATFTVTSTITLSPNIGRTGTTVLISGPDFNTGDTGCSISSTPSGLISSPTCAAAGGSVSGSFTVAGVSTGAYTVTVTGNLGDYGSASFTVPGPATLVLSPSTGPAGQVVAAVGLNYQGTTCLLTASPTGLFSSAPSCSIAAGALTGGFTVAPSASGGYTVTVSTNAGAGDSATATFTVTLGPAPTFILSPTTGPVGTAVIASGSNYAGTSCTLTFSPTGLLSAPTCAISAHTLTGGFVVPSGASAGGYIVTVTSNVGETVVATFTVTGPSVSTLTLSPSSGLVGTAVTVTVSGTNYAGTTCSLSSSPSGLFTSSTCTISAGTLTGSFTAASSASSGSYSVTVTTDVAADTRSATFTVTAGPTSTIALSPTSGPVGTVVTASGSNYLGTTCSLSSSPSGLLSSATCSVSGGSLTGGFIIASGSSVGSYSVTVTTNVAADTRSATFSVTAGPPPPTTFSLSPISGPAGAAVTVSGSNYLGNTCGLSSSPSGLLSSATCSISGGSLSGGFIVASGVSPGSYSVTVTTNIGSDTRSATFTVAPPTLTLSPTSGPVGTVVAASGSNYAGTTCTLSATPSTLFTSSSCNISGGSLSGGFTVATTAIAGSYTVTVTTNIAGETKSATFTLSAAPLPPCLIATATFGSATAPAVQFLRNFRDHQILSTASGSAFMLAFNAWYYSFSPYVAGYISTHSFERTAMMGVLIPLVGILEISSATFSAASAFPEFAALISGLVASSLIGAVYLGLPLSVVRARIRRLRRSRGQTLERTLLTILLGGLAVLVVGELLASPVLLMISSATVVLSALFLSAAFTSGRIARKLQAL